MDMNLNLQPKTKIRINRDFQSIQTVKPGSTLVCDNGIIWVTQSNDPQDYVLLPGQKLTVSRHGKILMEATQGADYHII
jgi:hypothetical protein